MGERVERRCVAEFVKTGRESRIGGFCCCVRELMSAGLNRVKCRALA